MLCERDGIPVAIAVAVRPADPERIKYRVAGIQPVGHAESLADGDALGHHLCDPGAHTLALRLGKRDCQPVAVAKCFAVAVWHAKRNPKCDAIAHTDAEWNANAKWKFVIDDYAKRDPL